MKDENNDQPNFLSTTRGKALIKLSLFALFFIFLYIYMGLEQKNINNNPPSNPPVEDYPNNTPVEVKTPSFGELKAEILSSKYSFASIINLVEVEIRLIGIKDQNTYTGVYHDGTEAITFKKVNDSIYELKNGKEVQNDKLFEKFNFKLFSVPSIIDLTSNIEPIIKIEEKQKIYKYELDEYIVEFVTRTKIESISVTSKENPDIKYITNLSY